MRVNINKNKDSLSPWRISVADHILETVGVAETVVLSDVQFITDLDRLREAQESGKQMQLTSWVQGRLLHAHRLKSQSTTVWVPLDLQYLRGSANDRIEHIMDDAYFWEGFRYCPKTGQFVDSTTGAPLETAEYVVFHQSQVPRYT